MSKESNKINVYVADSSYWLFSQWGKMGGAKQREMTCYARVQLAENKIFVSEGYMPKHHGTSGSVDVDDADLVRLMMELDSKGIPSDEAFRCWVHSHPGTGPNAAYLSGTDNENIDRQLLVCDYLVSIVFDSNGSYPFCRIDWKDGRFGRCSNIGNIVLFSGIQVSSLDGASIDVLNAFRLYNLGADGIAEAVKVFEEKSHTAKPSVHPVHQGVGSFQGGRYVYIETEEDEKKKKEESERQKESSKDGGGMNAATNGASSPDMIRKWPWDERTPRERRLDLGKEDPISSAWHEFNAMTDISGHIGTEDAGDSAEISETDFEREELINIFNEGSWDIEDFSISEQRILLEELKNNSLQEGLALRYGEDHFTDTDRGREIENEDLEQDFGIPSYDPKDTTHNED